MKKYPFRFEGPKVGDKCFAIFIDENNKLIVEETSITEVIDDSYHVKTDKEGKWLVDKNGKYVTYRSKNYKDYSIGYYVDNFESGHSLYFGEDLFLTRKDAEQSLKNKK